jgi:hypothetical protein
MIMPAIEVLAWHAERRVAVFARILRPIVQKAAAAITRKAGHDGIIWLTFTA